MWSRFPRRLTPSEPFPRRPKLGMHQALRCKARSKRTGKPCRSPAVRGWAVCRMHGARGGAPKAEANGNYKTGEHTAEVREARRLVRAILRRAKEARRLSEAQARSYAEGCGRARISLINSEGYRDCIARL